MAPSSNGQHIIQKAPTDPEKIRIAIRAKLIVEGDFTLQELGILTYIMAAVALNTEQPETVTPRSVVAHFNKNQPLTIVKSLESLQKRGYIDDHDGEIPQLLTEFGGDLSI